MFDQNWMKKANSIKENSWAYEVMQNIKASGGIYLETLRIWFDNFSLEDKQKKPLKRHIESFSNEEHLGAVNELAWWSFLKKYSFDAEPVPSENSSRPDFRVLSPQKFFIEVTTLNLSEQELINKDNLIELNQAENISRIINKIFNRSKKKYKQILFAYGQNQPCCLVLFDYASWSGFGTQLYHCLANDLLDIYESHREISAIIYIERYVKNGNIKLNCKYSSIYYNPYAYFPLEKNIFHCFQKYEYKTKEDGQGVTITHSQLDSICL